MERWRLVSGIVLVAGGVAWLGKLTVIVATGGRVTDTGAAGVLFMLGLALLALGAAGAGASISRRLPLRILGGLAGLVVFFVMFGIVGDALGAAIGDWGPAYASDEVGILVAALVAVAVGAWLLASGRRAVPAR